MSNSILLKKVPAGRIPLVKRAVKEAMSETGFPEDIRMRSFPFFTGIGSEQVRSLKKKGGQVNLAELALLSRKAAEVTWSGSAMCYKVGDFNPDDFSGFGDPVCEGLLRDARAAAVRFVNFDREIFMGFARSGASTVCCPHCRSEYRTEALCKHHAQTLLEQSAGSELLNQNAIVARISMSRDRDPKAIYETPAQTFSRLEATLLQLCNLMAAHLPSKKISKIKQALMFADTLPRDLSESVQSLVSKWDGEMPDSRLLRCPACGKDMVGTKHSRENRINAAAGMLDACLLFLQAKADRMDKLNQEFPESENFWLAVLDRSY